MNERQWTHYVSPKLQSRTYADKGHGLFVVYPVVKGELLVVWGGDVYTHEQLEQLPEHKRQHSIQVEENLYQVSPRHPEPGDFVNHSCNPNSGLNGQIVLVAMRPIAVGEEICFDYAMSDGSSYDEFECACGAHTCRGRVTGEDWKQPELQRRYAGYFSPYLQRRIDQMGLETKSALPVNGRYATAATPMD